MDLSCKGSICHIKAPSYKDCHKVIVITTLSYVGAVKPGYCQTWVLSCIGAIKPEHCHTAIPTQKDAVTERITISNSIITQAQCHIIIKGLSRQDRHTVHREGVRIGVYKIELFVYTTTQF